MKKMDAKIKKMAVILALAAMVPATGFAFDGHWGGGRSKGPPPDAIAACADLNEGDTVQFTSPRGDTVSGICRDMGGDLVAVPEKGFHGKHRAMGPGKRIDRMAKKLNLTEAQKEQVKAILTSERDKVEPLRQQLAKNRENLRKAIEAQPFNEATVRALARSQNETRVELVVSRARTKSEIFALLSPEQRELAKKLGPRGGSRHGHRGR
jgi:Spy/CpxP family protein refolding chaperone